jgi:hypothetical protein
MLPSEGERGGRSVRGAPLLLEPAGAGKPRGVRGLTGEALGLPETGRGREERGGGSAARAGGERRWSLRAEKHELGLRLRWAVSSPSSFFSRRLRDSVGALAWPRSLE